MELNYLNNLKAYNTNIVCKGHACLALYTGPFHISFHLHLIILYEAGRAGIELAPFYKWGNRDTD